MTRDGKRSWKETAKTTGRIAAIVLGIVVATMALGIGSLMVVARTDWGGERLRRFAVTRANQNIRGHLDVGRLRFGGDRLILSDLQLRDPEGQLAAQVARVEVDFRLAPLLRKELRITHARIEAPHVTAVSGPEGLNLARATEPRNRPAPKPPAPPTNLLDKEGWVVRLDDLLLSDGEMVVASTAGKEKAGRLREAVHISGLHLDLSARYATGNGATDLLLSLTGKSVREPTGPEALSAEVRRHAAGSHVAIDGALLGGSLRVRGDVTGPNADPAHTTLTASVSLPRTKLEGFWWGPLRLELAAAPDTAPRLDFLAAIPGLELTAATTSNSPAPAPSSTGPAAVGKGASPSEPFTIEGRLALSNLATTGQAVERLMARDVPPLAGRGELTVTVDGATTRSPTTPFAPWRARAKGLFERLRVAEATIVGLSIDGHATPLSTTTDDAALTVAAAAVESGATKLSRLHLDLRARDQNLTLAAGLSGPKPITLAADTRLDADRRGLALTRLTVVLPQATWASTQPARARFDENGTSLRGLHLEADGGQLLSLDGATTPANKTPARMNAHLEARIRLDLLPPPLLDPDLGVGGLLRAELTAAGEPAAPRASAQVRLEDGRFRRLSKIAAKVDATFADRALKGTLAVDAPAGAIDGSYNVPADLLTSAAPLHVNIEATRVDLSALLSGLGMQAPADGKLTARLQMDGSAGDPRADLVLDGLNLRARPPASPTGGRPAAPVDVGRVHVGVSYAQRIARASLELEAAHGGRARAAATTRVDLSYPAVTAPIDLKRLPIQGTLVARDFDVSWVSPFSARIESLKGLVTADARLAGTVGDPRVVGDVRWKNGQVVTVQAPSTDGKNDRKDEGPAGASARTGSFGAARGRAGSGRGSAGAPAPTPGVSP